MLNEEWVLEASPEDIVDCRQNKQGELEVLTTWQHLPQHDNTWESATVLQDTFPHFQLEDKLKSLGEGSDRDKAKGRGRPEITQVYKRGKRKVWLLNN
ncbi:hypothetical protein TanjilG_14598 [Lupinus angustifolius]|uniref:Chromo domain-containing protein n=1 Tax=Lupinus angustifolius TaxID=3871 RepID=A0A1J7GNF3_LUPAN|nr:hypothetical protein TanjilG_14598 [Lupinus angustifolius]